MRIKMSTLILFIIILIVVTISIVFRQSLESPKNKITEGLGATSDNSFISGTTTTFKWNPADNNTGLLTLYQPYPSDYADGMLVELLDYNDNTKKYTTTMTSRKIGNRPSTYTINTNTGPESTVYIKSVKENTASHQLITDKLALQCQELTKFEVDTNNAEINRLGLSLAAATALTNRDQTDIDTLTALDTTITASTTELQTQISNNLATIQSLQEQIGNYPDSIYTIQSAIDQLKQVSSDKISETASLIQGNALTKVENDITTNNIAGLKSDIDNYIKKIGGLSSIFINNKSSIKESQQILIASNLYISELRKQLRQLIVAGTNTGSSILNTLYRELTSQNTTFLNTLSQNDDSVINAQRIDFQGRQIFSLAYVNKYLLILYFIFICVVGYFIFYKLWSIYFRIAVFVVFLAFPFAIGPLENMILVWLKYIYSLLNGNVYNSKKY